MPAQAAAFAAAVAEHGTPHPDDVRVVVLGRGVGESVLLHIGDGAWVVVDSCTVPRTRLPAAHAYLNALRVPLDAVVAVVVTHLDRDHVIGIDTCLERAAADAPLLVSDAAGARETLAFLDLPDRPGKGADAGLRTLRRAVRLTEGTSRHALVRAKRHMLPLQDQMRERHPPVLVWALAPSEATTQEFRRGMRDLLVPDPPLVLPKRLQNLASLALHVQVGEVSVLLCGDLQADDRLGLESRGWPGVHLPPGSTRASLVKLGHHGSPNGDHDTLWERLVEPGAVAAVTPYNSGKRPLPGRDDLARVLERGHPVYVAGSRRSAGHDRSGGGASLSGTLGVLQHAQGLAAVRRVPGKLGAVAFDRPADGSAAWTVRTAGQVEPHPQP